MRWTVALLLLLPFVPSAPANEGSGCLPTTSSAFVMVGSGEANTWTFYVTLDVGAPNVLIPLPFIYQEMNGIDQLQRQDFVRDDTCGGYYYTGDLIVW